MARRKRRRVRRVRGVSGRYQKRKATRKGGKIPLTILKRRLAKLSRVVSSRS